MVERTADDSAQQDGILDTAGGDDRDVDASTATDAKQDIDDQQGQTDEAPVSQSRRGFGKLMLAGAAGAFGLSGTSEARTGGTTGWRDGYRRYATNYVREFYRSVPKKHNLYRCVKYVADRTNFWETLGEKMYLDRAVVTAAYAYPLPNYKPVKKKTWDGILGDMYADMPAKYKKKREYPIAVPVFVVYLYDGYYNAVAYLRPYGDYKSYGYVIKNGYQQQARYDSKADYESNTWWFTEDGWGDAGVTDGGILGGVPTSLV